MVRRLIRPLMSIMFLFHFYMGSANLSFAEELRPSVSVIGHGVIEDQGAATIRVRPFRTEEGRITVKYETRDKTAFAGLDYQSVTGTLTWDGSDESERQISIPILQDDVFEGIEEFEVALTDLQAPADTGNALARVEIRDDDNGIGFFQSRIDAKEGSVVEIILMRFGARGEEVTVHYQTQDGTALAGSDYEEVSGTLTWGPNEFSRVVSITLLDDTIGDPNENFSFVLFNPSPNTQVPENNAALIVIEDNDQLIQFDAEDINNPIYEFPEDIAGGVGVRSCPSCGGHKWNSDG